MSHHSKSENSNELKIEKNDTNDEKEQICKVVILGAAGVGKTSILNKYMYDNFPREYEVTVGIDFFTKKVQFENSTIALQMWDTAGQEKYQSLIPSYIRDTSVSIIVYSVDEPKSFSVAKQWIDRVKQQNGEDSVFLLVGNKIDLEDKVSQDDVKKYADASKMKSILVSAKTGQGITEMFDTLLTIHKQNSKSKKTVDVIAQPILLSKQKEQTSSSCC